MAYEETLLDDEEAYRNFFEENYCNPLKPIITFDDIWVRFYPDMFDHAFFKSRLRIKEDKSILCSERTKRIGWIKETLQDPTAILKIGWNKKLKAYDDSRRVAVIRGQYVVIVALTETEKARFITAYRPDEETLQLILDGPDWPPIKKR